MQENVSVLIATLLAIVIIVLFPIYNVASRQDSMANNMVVEATTSFVDEVRNKGYITTEEYQEYINKLNKTGNFYEVEMEIYEPVFVETEESTADNKVYEENYEIKYTSDILKELSIEDGEADIASRNTVLNKEVCYLDVDDKFYVRVKNTNITQAQLLFDRLFGGEIKERIVVNYGGIVYANEWENGEDAIAANSNIFISRPLKANGDEYKYDYITTTYDAMGNETPIYGIRVELNDDDADSGIIKFILTYKDIKLFEDDAGNVISDDLSKKSERMNHVKEYIEIIGFGGDSEVTDELSYVRNTRGLYDAQYEIKISNISYDYFAVPYIRGKVRINSGSAESNSGIVTQVNSKEFIIFYDVKLPEITSFTSNPDVITNTLVTIPEGASTLSITFTATAKANYYNGVIDKIIWVVRKKDSEGRYGQVGKVEGDTNSSPTTLSYAISLYTKGEYSVTVYAVDGRGYVSEEKTAYFKVTKLERKTQTYTSEFDNASVNSIEVAAQEGWKIISYKWETSYNYSAKYKHWYNIVDASNGTNRIILPTADEWPTSIDYTKTWLMEAYTIVTYTDRRDRNITYREAESVIGTENYKFEQNYYIQNYNSTYVIPQDVEIDAGKYGRAISTKSSDINIEGDLSDKNITKLIFNFRIDPSTDVPGGGMTVTLRKSQLGTFERGHLVRGTGSSIYYDENSSGAGRVYYDISAGWKERYTNRIDGEFNYAVYQCGWWPFFENTHSGVKPHMKVTITYEKVEE